MEIIIYGADTESCKFIISDVSRCSFTHSKNIQSANDWKGLLSYQWMVSEKLNLTAALLDEFSSHFMLGLRMTIS